MESTELQQTFFNTVKNSIPPHLSMVDEIADLLKLSYDSVYRRVRGEKSFHYDRGTGEKFRNRFFGYLHERVAALR